MKIEVPGVGIVEFPDGTPPAQIKAALAKYRQPPKGFGQTVWENVVGDNDPNSHNFGERVGAALNKAGEALTFGLVGDETDAAVRTGGGLWGDYDKALDANRQSERVLERDNPGVALGAELGGAVLGAALPGGQIGTLARGAPLLSKVGASALAGAGMGGTYGFMEGEGANRGDSAQTGALFGAGGGALAHPMVRLGGAAAGTIGGLVSYLRKAPSDKRARAALEKALSRSGKTAEEVDGAIAQAAQEGQPEYMVADAIGNAGQRQLAGITRTPNDARQAVVEALRGRQDAQAERMGPMVADAFGMTGTAKQTQNAIKATRNTEANAAYGAARSEASPVDVRGVLGTLDARLSGTNPGKFAQDSIDGIFEKYRNRLAGVIDGDNAELSDFSRILGVKQDLQDEIGTLVRAGKNNAVRELSPIVAALDEALEKASPKYRGANDNFARHSENIDAVETGSAAARPSARAQDVLGQFGALKPEAQQAFSVGRGDAILSQIERQAPGVNSARALTTPKVTAEIDGIAKNPELLKRQIGREMEMFETANAAMGGSKTADNLADAEDVASFDVGAVMNALQGRFSTAATQIGQKAVNMASGQNDETRALIAKYLMGKEVGPEVQKAIAATQKRDSRRALIEALMRRNAAVIPQ